MAYFDAASAAPLHPVARQALEASLDEGWADPARLYREGRRARLLLDAAREATAEAVGCRPDELTFTPSGTRAVHTGVAGALAGRRRAGRHLIVSAVEHSSVLHSSEAHEADGGTVTQVPVDRGGAVAAASYEAALREDTALSGVPLVSGGRSSGARVACRTAADVGAAAVLALAFPLHPPGRDTSRLPELLATDVPVLVVQGARDPFGAPEEFTAAVSLPRSVTVRAVAGDHALRRAPEQVAAATVAWLRGLGLLPAAAGTDHDGQPGTPT